MEVTLCIPCRPITYFREVVVPHYGKFISLEHMVGSAARQVIGLISFRRPLQSYTFSPSGGIAWYYNRPGNSRTQPPMHARVYDISGRSPSKLTIIFPIRNSEN